MGEYNYKYYCMTARELQREFVRRDEVRDEEGQVGSGAVSKTFHQSFCLSGAFSSADMPKTMLRHINSSGEEASAL